MGSSTERKIIVVMGPTGSGKSTFINIATAKNNCSVEHALKSSTSGIQVVETKHPTERFSVVFVDTPGFDDTYKSDTDTLAILAEWLNKNHKGNIKLSGIIYLHQISGNRITGSLSQSQRILLDLCGDKAMENVILATTMWSEVWEDAGARRERELLDVHWKPMLEKGTKTMRFHDSFESAWAVVDRIIHGPSMSLLIQSEMAAGKLVGDSKSSRAAIEVLSKLLKTLLRR